MAILAAVFAAAQLIRPERANPGADAARSVEAPAGASHELVAVLDRACSDCHSDHSAWPQYSAIAPLSWVVARAESEGRRAVDFSAWAKYSRAQQQTLLDASCRDVTAGKMPGGPYVLLRPEARLSPHDIETICSAAAQSEARDAGERREP